MNKHLFNKKPIVIDVELAQAIGLNEAIVVQQLNYWLNSKTAKIIDGKPWIYNTYQQWQTDNFPFWSVKTIKRVFSKLEKQGIVVSGNFNRAGFDKTKWYTIDLEKLDEKMGLCPDDGVNLTRREGQIDPMEGDNLTQPIPEITRDYTETTTTNTTAHSPSGQSTEPPIPYKEIISYLNKKSGKEYRVGRSQSKTSNRGLIKARWNDGFRLKDFKQVIDTKCSQWANDSKMNVYLRPATLFGNKFDQYLNEKTTEPSIQNDDGWKVAKAEDLKEGWDDGLPF